MHTVNAFHTFKSPELLHLPFISFFCSLYMFKHVYNISEDEAKINFRFVSSSIF